MSIGKLSGLSVLVTRPKEQSENLAALIIEKGGRAFIFPTLEIVSVDPVGGWESVSQKINEADIVIFTSANAVQEVLSKKIIQESSCEFAAIGTATQAAMAEHGLHCDWIPMKDYRSEGLLNLPVFQNLKNKNIIILGGEGGRDYLQSTLQERGAQVEKIAVYRRICPQSDPTVLKQFLAQQQPKIIVSTSVNALTNLLALSSEIADIRSIPLIVVSHRVKIVAEEQGFTDIHVANSASNVDMLGAIINAA